MPIFFLSTLLALTPLVRHSVPAPPRTACIRCTAGVEALTRVSVTLTKPLGMMLEERDPAGVFVADLVEGGSAAASGEVKKGDVLVAVGELDVSSASFDEVMETLIAAPEELELALLRTPPPPPEPEPTTARLTFDGEEVEVMTGQVLRTALLDNKASLYSMMGLMKSCGGAGQCAACIVDVVDGAENLSPETPTEQARLKKKPSSYRMACQTLVEGDVSVKLQPK